MYFVPLIKKSAFVGAWIRIFPKKNRVMLIKAIPSNIARGLFGGLTVILFLFSSQKKVIKEISKVQ